MASYPLEAGPHLLIKHQRRSRSTTTNNNVLVEGHFCDTCLQDDCQKGSHPNMAGKEEFWFFGQLSVHRHHGLV
jgi:hypothetical protein